MAPRAALSPPFKNIIPFIILTLVIPTIVPGKVLQGTSNILKAKTFQIPIGRGRAFMPENGLDYGQLVPSMIQNSSGQVPDRMETEPFNCSLLAKLPHKMLSDCKGTSIILGAKRRIFKTYENMLAFYRTLFSPLCQSQQEFLGQRQPFIIIGPAFSLPGP